MFALTDQISHFFAGSYLCDESSMGFIYIRHAASCQKNLSI